MAERRANVLARWSRLKSALGAWRVALEHSHSLQQFKRECDEVGAWLREKIAVAMDDSYKDPTNLPGKLQKHQAFGAEVGANEERIRSTVAMGQGERAEGGKGKGPRLMAAAANDQRRQSCFCNGEAGAGAGGIFGGVLVIDICLLYHPASCTLS